MNDRLGTRFLQKTFWDVVDWMPFLALANLAAMGLCLTILGIPFALGGMLEVAAKAARAREPEWEDFWRGARRRWGWALVWLLAILGTAGSLWAGIFFYPRWLGLAGHFAAGANLWLCLGLLAALLLAPGGWALGNLTPAGALRLGIFLVFAHPLHALRVLFWTGMGLLVTAMAFPIALPFVSFAAGAAGLMAAWVVPMRQHIAEARRREADQERESKAPAAPQRPPASWKEIKARETQAEIDKEALFLERDEATRSFGELWRPWAM
jgi:hypothetical protein